MIMLHKWPLPFSFSGACRPGSKWARPKSTSWNLQERRQRTLAWVVRVVSMLCAKCITRSINRGLLVIYWLKHWTADRNVQGSSPTCSRDLFLFWVHSALPQKLSRSFSFASFGGYVKPSVPGNPLKLA